MKKNSGRYFPIERKEPGRGLGGAFAGLTSLLLAALPWQAKAFNVYDGSQYGNNLEINLSTTFSYTGAWRVQSPSAVLENSPNNGDGDNNFQHGLVNSLFEAVPILDIQDGNYGAHFSGQFYLNTVYLGTNQNDHQSLLNSIYMNKNNDFSSGTRNVEGENAQWLDANVYAQHDFVDGQSIQVKVGRQVLFWGQSIFFDNGISGGQAPVNTVVAKDIVNPQLQQIYMPVGQAVVTYQPAPGLTLQGYYQFEWEHDYLPASGAYFSTGDLLDAGGQSVIVGSSKALGTLYYLRTNDHTPPSQNGQFGLSAQYQLGEWDLGVYGLRYDAKQPNVIGISGPDAPVSTPIAKGFQIGRYYLIYPQDIWLEGVSASTNFGAVNVAGEVSVRENNPLVFTGVGSATPTNPGNANSDPLYPVGTSMESQISEYYISPPLPLDPGGVTLLSEIEIDHLLRVTKNRALLPHGLQATAAAINVTMTPTYNDVLPNLDVTFPLGVQYGILGRSQVNDGIYHGVGSYDAGIDFVYKTVWKAALTYQGFFGKPNTTWNPSVDRAYIALNVQRAF